MAGIRRLGPLEILEWSRRLVEKATGVRPTATVMIGALAEMVIERVAYTPKAVEHLCRENAQQDAINGCVRWSMRTLGPQASYNDAYQVYLKNAEALGLPRMSSKRFKNRALTIYGDGVNLPENILPLRPRQASLENFTPEGGDAQAEQLA